LLPPLARMREAAREVALAAALAAVAERVAPDKDEATLRAAIASAQWEPDYTN
jgi:malate dehydrogenase (oxaloacetate-decarboxylating)